MAHAEVRPKRGTLNPAAPVHRLGGLIWINGRDCWKPTLPMMPCTTGGVTYYLLLNDLRPTAPVTDLDNTRVDKIDKKRLRERYGDAEA